MLDHFRFLKKHADRAHVTAKMTIPSPAVLHFRGGRKAISKEIYPDLEEFYLDLGKTYRKAVKAFYDAGCRYLQFDEVFIAMMCDEKYREAQVKRGDNPMRLAELYADLINAAMAGAPADMTFSMHLCRGNYRSTFMGAGGYEPVAEVLFDRIKVHGYFMEYDSDRAGGFEPLRLLPKDRMVVLGLVTTKTGQLESRDAIRRRIEEASKFAPLDQLCLSPQCGFASSEEGNTLAEDEQWAKLRMIVEIADEVWGR
jgi:5-methyltetrahydropteroyltriglutamate--homocysteine methyltransferase